MQEYYREPKPEYFVSSLTLLYKQVVRDGLDGKEHVEALLRLRGVDPDVIVVPKREDKRFRRGQLTRRVLAILREGPCRPCGIANRIREGTDWDRWQVYNNTYRVLKRLEKRGVVVNSGGVWELSYDT